MSDYSYKDMLRMQSEAKQRVLEMQKRSRDVIRDFGGHGNPEKAGEDKKEEEELPRVPKAISFPAELHSQGQRQASSPHKPFFRTPSFDVRKALTDIFGNLSQDEYEKMFILSLCLLLSKEKGDDSLIFALMYLIT